MYYYRKSCFEKHNRELEKNIYASEFESENYFPTCAIILLRFEDGKFREISKNETDPEIVSYAIQFERFYLEHRS